jgi:CheY-like chemotaxis protein
MTDEIAIRPEEPGAAPTPARVLVVDDEAAVGRSTRMLLAPDYDITPVTRARDGLALLASGERYDAIVCDLMMPEMSGIEFYHQLSAEDARRVVFLTGGAFTPQARDFLDAVPQPHIDKPFEEYELRTAIERVRVVD